MAAAESALDRAIALQKRTKDFAVRVFRLCEALPSNPRSRVIADQLLRSSSSVAANYRAVCRARSRAEFISKIGVVVEEADETVFWLEFLSEVGIIPENKLELLLGEANAILAIMAASQRTARR